MLPKNAPKDRQTLSMQEDSIDRLMPEIGNSNSIFWYHSCNAWRHAYRNAERLDLMKML